MKYRFVVPIVTLALLAGCSGAKEKLGLVKEAPDEFQVVKRAPLEMPPNYNLRPPEPGAPRPQEQRTVEQAKQAVFGGAASSSNKDLSAGEAGLLQEAGAGQADANIRREIDKETVKLGEENKPVIDKLLSVTGKESEPAASVVDPVKEAERLKKNAEAGKPVTAGETPTIEE